MSIYLLKPTTRHYDWGKHSTESLVASLVGESENKPYAELWMGAHPSSPSMLEVDGKLSSLTALAPSLPFLFKVLSIARPLSIQLHPDLSLAKKLHAKDPENYPDSNHKPEVAFALTEVDLLYAFRPMEQIRRNLSDYQALENICAGAGNSQKEVYAKLLFAEPSLVAKQVDLHEKTLLEKVKLSKEDTYFLECLKSFRRDDIGLFSLYLLNLVTLNPGQAVFSLPKVPHAYLSGDLLECMASSDNTIRAGLTNKFCDKERLYSAANYSINKPALVELVSAPFWMKLKTPAKEFELKYSDKGQFEDQVLSDSIVLNLSGLARIKSQEVSLELGPGQAAFIKGSENIVSFEHDSRLFLATSPLGS